MNLEYYRRVNLRLGFELCAAILFLFSCTTNCRNRAISSGAIVDEAPRIFLALESYPLDIAERAKRSMIAASLDIIIIIFE